MNLFKKKAKLLLSDSINKSFDNDSLPVREVIVSFENIDIMYRKDIKQVYVLNKGPTTYSIQFRVRGGNNTRMEKDFGPIVFPNGYSKTIKTGEEIYFTVDGDLNENYNIDSLNAHCILDDLTLRSPTNRRFRTDMNNQNMDEGAYKSVNEILMKYFIEDVG